MYINKEQKEKIQNKIKEVESKSSAEILAVISNSAKGYFLPKFIVNILPKKYKQNIANKYINNYFYNIQKQHKDVKNIVLFFVCLDEQYVKIITSKNISNKITNSYWQDIINNFIVDIKRSNLDEGFLKAMNSCKDILIEKFPNINDENKIKNDIVQL